MNKIDDYTKKIQIAQQELSIANSDLQKNRIQNKIKILRYKQQIERIKNLINQI